MKRGHDGTMLLMAAWMEEMNFLLFSHSSEFYGSLLPSSKPCCHSSMCLWQPKWRRRIAGDALDGMRHGLAASADDIQDLIADVCNYKNNGFWLRTLVEVAARLF